MTRKPEQPLKYLDDKKPLSQTELQFMRFIWEHPEGISSGEIYDHFPQARGTKSTILYNISEKGYVNQRQEGLHHIYHAAVSEEAYNEAVLKQQMEKLFGSASIHCLIAAFCGKKELTEKQRKRVDQMIQEMKNEMGEH